jgi:SAM-dependent methyltransferase
MASDDAGPFGDTPQTSYVAPLDLFYRFAEPELRALIGDLGLKSGDVVLDAGCGTGVATQWLAQHVMPDGLAIGIDLSTDHVQRARRRARPEGLPLAFLQADLTSIPLTARRFDLIWCSNTIIHLRDALDGARTLVRLLRPGGRLALAQSLFLPEMVFAWDERLEKETVQACRRYYRDQYGLDERDTTAMRNLLGLLQRAGLGKTTVKTVVIERAAPLTSEDEAYFLDGLFRAHWGSRLRPYLSPDDWAELERLCDPDSPRYCLRRPDFHHLQTYTVVIGGV